MSSKEILTKITAVIATVLFCLISPFIFILIIIPIQILRCLVGVSAKFLRPDLIQLVSTRSAIWTQDNLAHPESNISFVAILDNKISAHDFAKEFETKVILRKRADNPSVLQFPRLQQYYEYWLDFSFWKWEPKFDLSRHFVTHSEIVTGKEELLELVHTINRQAWDRDISPWSGVVVENYCGNNDAFCSAWIFKIHHSVADAFATQCIIDSLLGGRMQLKLPFNDITRNSGQGKTKLVVNPLRIIYDLIHDLLQVGSSRVDYGVNMIKDRQFLYNSGNFISCARIEEIQQKFGVSMTAVQGAMVGAGLLKMFQKNNMFSRVPDFLHVMFPYSHPGHSREITNYLTFVFLKIPVGITTDSVKRLKLVEQSVSANRDAGLSKLYSVIAMVIGGFFGSIIKRLYKVDLPSGVMLGLCIEKPIEFQGAKVTDILFISGPLPGNQGIFFFFMDFMKGLDIGVGISESFTRKFPQVSQILIKDMLDEFNNLHELCR